MPVQADELAAIVEPAVDVPSPPPDDLAVAAASL